MKSKSLRYKFNVLGFSIIVFLFLRQGLTAFFQEMGASQTLSIWLVCSIVTLILSSIIPTLLIEKLANTHPLIFKKVKLAPSLLLVGYSYFLITAVSVANTLFLRILQKFGIEFAEVSIQPIDSVATFILYFVLLCIVPAVVEEIFLRGYILNMLKPYGRSFAIVASAVCFTFMHSQVQNMLPIFCCGVLLACIYCLTDSIWVCMALHFVNNAISFTMMYMTDNVGGVSALSFGIYLNIFVIVFGLISRAYLHKMDFRMSQMLKNDEKLEDKIYLFFKSPMAVIALLLFIMMLAEQLYKGIFGVI